MESKPRVLLARGVPKPALEMLQAECTVFGWMKDTAMPREEFLKQAATAEAIVCLPSEIIDEELLEAAPNLKVVATMSVGYEHINQEACAKLGIAVGYAGDLLSQTVAEWTLTLALATSRRLVEANRAVLADEWGGKEGMWMCGRGIRGAVVGVVGMGQIGAAFTRLLPPFGPSKILYYSRSKKEELAREFGVSCRFHRSSTLEELLAESDFVIMTASLNPSTELMFGRKAFAAMKNDAIFINVTRGGVVDQEALYEALTSADGIGAAGLDATTPEPLPAKHPLLSLPNCLVTPHLGAGTVEIRVELAKLAAANALAGLKNQPLPSPLF